MTATPAPVSDDPLDASDDLDVQRRIASRSRFERPNVYRVALDAPYDRRFVLTRVPKDLRVLGRRKEWIEHWDVIEASFYPSGLVEFGLACHGRTMDGYEKTERHDIAGFAARDLLVEDHPARSVAPLLVSLGLGERTGADAQHMVWAVFYHLLLRTNDDRLRWVLPDDHWLTWHMDEIQEELRTEEDEAEEARPRRRIREWWTRSETAPA